MLPLVCSKLIKLALTDSKDDQAHEILVLNAEVSSQSSDKPVHTVNSEIFARTLFSRSLCAKFRENKTLAKWQNHSVVN